MLEEGLAASIIDAQRQPEYLAGDILELRAYAKAREMVERAEKESDLPKSPMIDLVFEFVGEKAQEQKRGGVKTDPTPGSQSQEPHP